jgi:hypothetical protein
MQLPELPASNSVIRDPIGDHLITPQHSAMVVIDYQPAQVGAMSWLAVTSEWAPDYTTRERAALVDVTRCRGGSAALMVDCVMAQVTAGLVSPPCFQAAPIPAGSR